MDAVQPPIRFPPVEAADSSGLVALSQAMPRALLVSAYMQGIFPWTSDPIGWFAPPRRAILPVQEARFPSNFPKLLRRAAFTVSFDAAFDRVIEACRMVHADDGEWITSGFVRAYTDLWTAGYAHSVEVWQGDTLVGGLYGVQVGGMFCAESMFAVASNASKAALFALIAQREALGVSVIDVQVLSDTTERLGARTIARAAYMQLLAACLHTFAARRGQRWPKNRTPLRAPSAKA